MYDAGGGAVPQPQAPAPNARVASFDREVGEGLGKESNTISDDHVRGQCWAELHARSIARSNSFGPGTRVRLCPQPFLAKNSRTYWTPLETSPPTPTPTRWNSPQPQDEVHQGGGIHAQTRLMTYTIHKSLPSMTTTPNLQKKGKN